MAERVEDVGGKMLNLSREVGPPRYGWEAGVNYLGQKITRG